MVLLGVWGDHDGVRMQLCATAELTFRSIPFIILWPSCQGVLDGKLEVLKPVCSQKENEVGNRETRNVTQA